MIKNIPRKPPIFISLTLGVLAIYAYNKDNSIITFHHIRNKFVSFYKNFFTPNTQQIRNKEYDFTQTYEYL